MIVELTCDGLAERAEARLDETINGRSYYSVRVPLDLAIRSKHSGEDVRCIPPSNATATPCMFMDRKGPFYGSTPITFDDPYPIWFEVQAP